MQEFGPVYTVKCVMPGYEASTESLVCVQSSFWYSQNPTGNPNSFSPSKSKPSFPITSFIFLLVPVLSVLASCAIRRIEGMSLHFVAVGFFIKVITITSLKWLGPSPVPYRLLISYVISLRPQWKYTLNQSS